METLGAAASQLGAYMQQQQQQQQSRLEKRHPSGEEDPVSEAEMSRDGDSPDTLSRVPPSDVDPETLERLRRQEREEREEIEKELRSQEQDSNGNKGLLGGGGGAGGLPLGLEGLEAFRRTYLASPLSRMPPGFPGLLPPPPLPHSNSTPPAAPGMESSYKSNTPNSSQHSTPSSEFSSQQNWSFEEQFKQLYELNDDPKRKEFLDDLFSFMQKRGTPINRLPIMAKQVLDLYELYNLVCARGGLVEVINKKQWQEIIKGLNLPSSITSAAFTLRTQYTKYIYPYECENKKLSHPNELQSAIEGNRREGRRSGYESYNMFSPHHHSNRSPSMPLPPTSLGPHLTSSLRSNFNGGNMFSSGNLGGGGKSSPPGGGGSPLNALEMTRLALFKMYNQASGGGHPHGHPHLPPFIPDKLPGGEHLLHGQTQHQHASRGHHHQHGHHHSRRKSADESRRPASPGGGEEEILEDHVPTSMDLSTGATPSSGRQPEETEDRVSPPPVKRERIEAESSSSSGPPVSGANIRIANRGDNAGDSSLVVSLEINSVMYQGVLFAQSGNSNKSTTLSGTGSSTSNSSGETKEAPQITD